MILCHSYLHIFHDLFSVAEINGHNFDVIFVSSRFRKRNETEDDDDVGCDDVICCKTRICEASLAMHLAFFNLTSIEHLGYL